MKDKRLSPGQAFEALKVTDVLEEDRRRVTIQPYLSDGPAGRPHWVRLDLHYSSAIALLDKIHDAIAANPVGGRVVVNLGWNQLVIEELRGLTSLFSDRCPVAENKVKENRHENPTRSDCAFADDLSKEEPELPEEIATYIRSKSDEPFFEGLTKLILKYARPQ